MHFNLIVAMCRNNGIGLKGKLPWNIKEDLHHFSKLTKGSGRNALLMGHTTWSSLNIHGKEVGLIDRDNFVLSRSNCFDLVINHNHLIKTFKSYEDFNAYIELNSIYDEVWVMGGSQLYDHFMNKCQINKCQINKCHITYIDADFECDTFFPALDMSMWEEVERKRHYNTTYKCNVDYCVLQRR